MRLWRSFLRCWVNFDNYTLFIYPYCTLLMCGEGIFLLSECKRSRSQEVKQSALLFDLFYSLFQPADRISQVVDCLACVKSQAFGRVRVFFCIELDESFQLTVCLTHQLPHCLDLLLWNILRCVGGVRDLIDVSSDFGKMVNQFRKVFTNNDAPPVQQYLNINFAMLMFIMLAYCLISCLSSGVRRICKTSVFRISWWFSAFFNLRFFLSVGYKIKMADGNFFWKNYRTKNRGLQAQNLCRRRYTNSLVRAIPWNPEITKSFSRIWKTTFQNQSFSSFSITLRFAETDGWQ